VEEKEEKKAIFACRKCQKNISTTRSEVEEAINSKESFECPHCQAKNTKIADLYTRIL
jgi:Zn finger protein HypA/HybF involved in hydrogenase expression